MKSILYFDNTKTLFLHINTTIESEKQKIIDEALINGIPDIPKVNENGWPTAIIKDMTKLGCLIILKI